MGGSTTSARPADFAGIRHRTVAKLQALVRIPTVSHVDPGQRDEAPFIAFTGAGPAVPAAAPAPGAHPDPGSCVAVPMARRQRRAAGGADGPHRRRTGRRGRTWRHPAFEARIVDGQLLWGRGTLDDKGCPGRHRGGRGTPAGEGIPPRSGHLVVVRQAEISGDTAELAVAELRSRGVEPWFVLDEGGAVAADAFPGIKPPLAVVGVSEKGTTTLELRVDGRGGHASTPVRMDATARLARAIVHRGRQPVPGIDPGADARDVPPDRAARPAPAAGSDRQRRAAAPGAHPGG